MITHKMIISQGENSVKSISLNEFDNKLFIRVADEDLPFEDSNIAFIGIDKKQLHELIGTLLYCQTKLNKSK